jgi:hypothetical protein
MAIAYRFRVYLASPLLYHRAPGAGPTSDESGIKSKACSWIDHVRELILMTQAIQIVIKTQPLLNGCSHFNRNKFAYTFRIKLNVYSACCVL